MLKFFIFLSNNNGNVPPCFIAKVVQQTFFNNNYWYRIEEGIQLLDQTVIKEIT